MKTMSSKFFQGLGAVSSSIEVDYLRLSGDSVRSLAHLVSKGLQLNERQCQDLSSKLVQTVENIQKLVSPSGPLKVPFGPALKNLYRVLEKAKLLVLQCCDPDWCRAAVFQNHNEESFGEVLLEVGLCYNVIYELRKGIVRDWEWTLIPAEDLRQSSLFMPASESEVREDEESLKRSLEQVAGTSSDWNSCLASYLLTKLECISEARMNKDFNVPDASLWMNETEPQGTWKLQRIIGRGSGASCVCRYEWLDIPCARKEFHSRETADIFRREAAILAQLNHPNIVKFFCCGSEPEMGECFIAMELMEMSLASLIESRGKAGRSFPILFVLDIMIQIARGVCYLHGLNIAHRDLKPLNVVVTDTRAAHLEDCFCVKLVDFGMSKTKVQVSKSDSISIPGVGTTKYRAPEVFPQAQRVFPGLKWKVNWFRADAYSFGITCAVLLSLKEPFEGVPRSRLYEELLQGVRPELPGERPEALVALLKDCWATDPQSRPGFAEICSRLEKCKLQELLRVSSKGLQGVAGCEYIETVLMKQSHEQSLCATGVLYEQSQCASRVSCHSDAAEEAVGISQFDEDASSLSDDYSDDYSDDRQSILSELKPKKRVGLWSRTMSFLANVMTVGASHFGMGSDVDDVTVKGASHFGMGSQFPGLAGLAEVRTSAVLSCPSHSPGLSIQDFCQEMLGDSGSQEFDNPTIFSYDELGLATQVGDLSSGTMYKGVLRNGSVVGVKRTSSFVNTNEFLLDVKFFLRVRHKNIVTLKGCCLHDQQRLLVYEYVENFNVHHILLDEGPSRQILAWPARFKICLGVAEGLHYLHEETHPRIIHGNITATNVFLDRNFNPKIGGFGLAVLFPDEQSDLSDTVPRIRGYMPPEYFQRGLLSDKADVYSFGVLCLEIISGRRNCEVTLPRDQRYLYELAWRLHEEDRLLDLVDPTLHLTDVEVRDVQRVIKLCLMCLQDEANKRPSMTRIVSILQGDSECDAQVLR